MNLDPIIINPRQISSLIRSLYWNKYKELVPILEHIRAEDLIITTVTSLEAHGECTGLFELFEAVLPQEDFDSLDLPLCHAWFQEVSEFIIYKLSVMLNREELYFEAADETELGSVILYPDGHTRMYL